VGLLKQTAGMHPVSHFFPVNMIFSAVQPLGTIKYAWGLIPEGVHGDHCQLPTITDSVESVAREVGLFINADKTNCTAIVIPYCYP